MIQIYHNNRCSKSRSALQALEKSGKAFEIIYYLEAPIGRDKLIKIIEKLNIEPFELVRKGEKIYLENFKNKVFSAEEWINILLENPVLMERPIVVSDNKAVIARPTERINEILEGSAVV